MQRLHRRYSQLNGALFITSKNNRSNMEQKLYDDILVQIRSHRGLTRNCLKVLKTKFPSIKHETISSILSLEYQRLMRQTFNKSEAVTSRLYNRYLESLENREAPGIIVRMAEEISIAPCLIGKLILGKHFEATGFTDGDGQSNALNKYMKNTSLIVDPILANEIFLCTIYDDQYSPIVETMKSSLGQQYEIELCREITNLGLTYRDEDYLRKFGYDKTPDVKLEVPVAIDGFIIHWIESKALFGDSEVHREYTRNQYSSYWNRFGPGLVIYWFGYVQSITSPSDRRFIIRDHMPRNIITINKPT